MNSRTLVGPVIVCGLALAVTRIGISQDPTPVGAGLDGEAMLAMMKLAQPGAEHEELARLCGEWEIEASIQMMPGVPPTDSKATASSRMILGGRYLEILTSGSFMGQEFESRSILGFDRRHEEYTMIGLDTLGTYWVTGRGKRGEDGVIRMDGEDDDPAGKQVYTFGFKPLDDDHYEYGVVFRQLGPQVFDPPFRMMTARSTRRKE